MGVNQEGYKDLAPEKALIASKVRERKILVGAMSPDFCQSGVGAGTQYLAGLNPLVSGLQVDPHWHIIKHRPSV